MQHLCAEVRHLHRLDVGNLWDDECVGHRLRVRGHDTIHIGPYLNFFGVEAGSQNASGKIGAAAAKGRGDSVHGRGDEARHDSSVGKIRKKGPDAGQRFGLKPVGISEFVIGDDELPRIHGLCLDTGLGQGQTHDASAEAFTVGGHKVERPRRQVVHKRNSQQQRRNLIEKGLCARPRLFVIGRLKERSDHRMVPLRDSLKSPLPLAPFAREPRRLQEGIGDAGECRHYQYALAGTLRNADERTNRLWAAHRCAAKLENLHRQLHAFVRLSVLATIS